MKYSSLLASMILCASALTASADNVVTSNGIIRTDNTASFAVNLKSDAPITAFQMDLVLPENVSKDVTAFEIAPSRKADDTKITGKLKGNVLRLVAYSETNKNLLTTDGHLLTVALETADGVPCGEYPVQVSNVIITAYDASSKLETGYNVAASAGNLCFGDVNNDGALNTADAIAIVNSVISKEQSTFISETADVNRDASINTADAIALTNKVIGK